MKYAKLIFITGVALAFCAAPLYAGPNGDEAIQKLMDGNQRFIFGQSAAKDMSDVKRKELTKGQHPFAVVLSCSDSRVPPEHLFDQGLGDLFVVRTAGNVVDKISIGSLEYGVEHLHAPLLVILGHAQCGAVQATVEAADKPHQKAKGHAHDSIGAIVDKIMPAVKEAKKAKSVDVIDAAVQGNVRNVYKELLAKSPVLKELIHEGKLKVVLALYYLDSGAVKILDNAGKHPQSH